ncbi:MAG: hypothetical protein ACLR2O_04255 [Coprococcus sp.]
MHPNIVCTQPFACLPNHVVGKGVIKEPCRRHPESNIVAIDYDPGASEVNQLNRIKLMLSTAQKKTVRLWICKIIGSRGSIRGIIPHAFSCTNHSVQALRAGIVFSKGLPRFLSLELHSANSCVWEYFGFLWSVYW